MIEVLPRFLSDQDIQTILSVAGSSHHDDEGGHIRTRGTFKANKPYFMPRVAECIRRCVQNIVPGFSAVDANVQVYRLNGNSSCVQAHMDEDFTVDGLVARYSVLVRLNSEYEGGETRFQGNIMPHIPLGGGLVFNHDLLHEGLPVLSGEKLILKTDIFV